MAYSAPMPRSTGKSYRRQALIWLMVTLLLAVMTALVWMASQTPAIGTKIENAPIATPQVTVSELEQPLSIESLHELDTDVQPINFEETIRDLRNYPDEFKDKGYLLANKGKWTVQVMNVAENDVIVSYLEGRKDRNKFAYFRYRDEDKQLRYMLTYGLMSSPQEAVGGAKLIDFGLPADVRVLAEEVNRYVSIIDNYERPQPIKDLSTKRARAVKLKPTKREVPARQKAPVVAEKNDSNNNANNDSQASTKNSNKAESIRQSADTSATLTVNEERTLSSDNDTAPAKQETKKPPVVATPKPPSSATSQESGSKKPAANTDKAASKNSADSMKELIEDKSN